MEKTTAPCQMISDLAVPPLPWFHLQAAAQAASTGGAATASVRLCQRHAAQPRGTACGAAELISQRGLCAGPPPASSSADMHVQPSLNMLPPLSCAFNPSQAVAQAVSAGSGTQVTPQQLQGGQTQAVGSAIQQGTGCELPVPPSLRVVCQDRGAGMAQMLRCSVSRAVPGHLPTPLLCLPGCTL